MDAEDLNKKNRDYLDPTIKDKLMSNLQWSMLFFLFNQLCMKSGQPSLHKKFFKGWKNFTEGHLIKKDLEAINTILNSPKNMFHSLLQNKGDTIESTEIYQEKYNKIMNSIEHFYFSGMKSPDEEDED